MLCTDAEYRRLCAEAGLEVLVEYRPFGRDEEGEAWVSENRVAPWAIWVMGRAR